MIYLPTHSGSLPYNFYYVGSIYSTLMRLGFTSQLLQHFLDWLYSAALQLRGLSVTILGSETFSCLRSPVCFQTSETDRLKLP